MESNRIFELIASEMMNRFELIKLQPEELRGRAREVVVHEFLEPFLPTSLGIGSGVIISATKERSGQTDVVIYDKSAYDFFKPFTWYMPKEAQLFPSEVVYAVIEVEHKLSPDKLSKCAERIERVKKIPKSAL